MIKRSLLTLAGGCLVASLWAVAQEHGQSKGAKISDREECKLNEINKFERMPLNTHLSYFITTANGKIFIIGSRGNSIVDPADKSITRIPGSIDPVSTPDGDFVSIPMSDGESFDKPDKNTKKTDPFKDRNHWAQTIYSDTENPEMEFKDGRSTENEDLDDGLDRFRSESKSDDDDSASIDSAKVNDFFDSGKAKDGMHFYRISDLKPGAKDLDKEAKPVFVDAAFQGNYQSIGIISKSKSETRYRLINDGAWAEYSYKNGKFRRVAGADEAPCSTIIKDKNKKTAPRNDDESQEEDEDPDESGTPSLPMLSKDGKYLSVYRSGRQSTVIYKLNPKNPAECTEVLSVGFPTGKVDFSADNSQIAFHIDNHDIEEDQFGDVAESINEETNVPTKSKDSIVLHLKTNSKNEIQGIKGYSRLSANPTLGTGTYYPRFSADGTIVAAHQEGNSFGLDFFKAKNLPVHRWWNSNLESEADKETTAVLALGALWHESCWKGAGQNIPTVTQQALLVPNLDPKSCSRLVDEMWLKYSQVIRERLQALKRVSADVVSVLSPADLKAACPKSGGSEARSDVAFDHLKKEDIQPVSRGSVLNKVYTEGYELFKNKCLNCHGIQGGPKSLPVEAMSATELENAGLKIKLGLMPPGGGLSAEEQLDLFAFLRSNALIKDYQSK